MCVVMPPTTAPASKTHRGVATDTANDGHVVPVLFGQGRRLFEGLAAEQIELERTRVLEGEGGVTHMHYRVRR
jgi:hypothetical protein